MQYNFRYISAMNNTIGMSEYMRQVEVVNNMIERRMNALAEKYNVLPLLQKEGCATCCVDIYIRLTKGMPLIEKMEWLSKEIGDDHDAWMKEWTKLCDIDKYAPTSDFETTHRLGIKIR